MKDGYKKDSEMGLVNKYLMTHLPTLVDGKTKPSVSIVRR